MTEPDLKPCPFCGQNDIVIRERGPNWTGLYWDCEIFCRECGCSSARGNSDSSKKDAQEQAIFSWNTRDQWLSIKTAPRDATKILIWHPPVGKKSGFVSRDWWYKRSGKGCWYNTRPSRQPTHWQPLPSPPVEPDTPTTQVQS